ncbi:MAG: type III-A CRISPR-associated protein Csm2 [Anaerolineae bacterium]
MKVLFNFGIKDLETVYKKDKEAKEALEKERKFLERMFQAWGLPSNGRIQLDDTTLKHIITADGTSEEESARLLVDWADKLGAILKSAKLSSSQLRNFFGAARIIQGQGFDSPKARRQFILLLPKLRYAAKRANTLGMDGLRDVLEPAIKYVENDPRRFKRFMEFFEAILAYHKAYGGD